MIKPSTPQLQENEIYHVLDGETQEESVERQQRPAGSSQGNNLPKSDPSIPKDVKSGDEQDAHSSFYHVIDILWMSHIIQRTL